MIHFWANLSVRLVREPGIAAGIASDRIEVSPIRIHLGPMPAMLQTIITDLLRQEPDLVIVGQTGRGQDPLRSARDDHANVLITQDCTQSSATCLDTILSAAPLGIFALSADGQKASSVRLVRQSVELDSLKRVEFADAIRRTADHLELSRGEDGISPAQS